MASLKRHAEMGNANGVFKSFARVLRKSEKHLLLSTTYGLNNSFSKRIVVGLGTRNSDEFEPLIKLMNHTPEGVCMGLRAWTALCGSIDIISDYFDISVHADAQFWIDEIALGDCYLRFTTAHGERAIRFDLPDVNEDSSPEQVTGKGERRDQEDSPLLCKRPKLFRPSIVIQQTTFNGLKSVLVCIDERIRRLQRLASSVNLCRKQYIDYLVSKVNQTTPKVPSLQTITQIVKHEYNAARENIKPKQTESFFSENYFDIVLLEFATLYSNHFAVEVKHQIELKQQSAAKEKPELQPKSRTE